MTPTHAPRMAPAMPVRRALLGVAMPAPATPARHTLHQRHASWDDVRAAYVYLRDAGELTADDERMAEWHECTDAWTGEVR